jgi:hypothetical protein
MACLPARPEVTVLYTAVGCGIGEAPHSHPFQKGQLEWAPFHFPFAQQAYNGKLTLRQSDPLFFFSIGSPCRTHRLTDITKWLPISRPSRPPVSMANRHRLTASSFFTRPRKLSARPHTTRIPYRTRNEKTYATYRSGIFKVVQYMRSPFWSPTYHRQLSDVRPSLPFDISSLFRPPRSRTPIGYIQTPTGTNVPNGCHSCWNGPHGSQPSANGGQCVGF